MDDGQVADDDGDKGFTAGPKTAADCAFGTGLGDLVLARVFFGVLDCGF